MLENIEIIDNQPALLALCKRLAECDWVALDTEFLRERTYFPKLCLLQLATPRWVACVDPLALSDLDVLLDSLYRDDLTKVMHACSQDMEIFHHLRDVLPGPVFDTQVAAPLLGYPEQMGYANLVRERLDIQLDKTQTRTDWSRRPLRDEQIEYAADDVRLLARMFPSIREELLQLGRLDWLADDFSQLADRERYARPPVDAWQRIRGWDRLGPASLAALQQLAEWREETARAADRPRNSVLRDEQLVDIARQRITDRAALAEVRNLPESTVRRHADAILRCVRESLDRTPRAHPNPRGDPASVPEEALADAVTALIRLTGLNHGLNPASIASRKDVLRLIQHQDSPLLHGWRKQIIGADLSALLAGDKVLRVADGQLRLSEARY